MKINFVDEAGMAVIRPARSAELDKLGCREKCVNACQD